MRRTYVRERRTGIRMRLPPRLRESTDRSSGRRGWKRPRPGRSFAATTHRRSHREHHHHRRRRLGAIRGRHRLRTPPGATPPTRTSSSPTPTPTRTSRAAPPTRPTATPCARTRWTRCATCAPGSSASLTTSRDRIAADTSPANALHRIAHAEHAALVIVGSTHTGRAGRVLPGSTGERLLHGSPCSVAVVPKDYREHATSRSAGSASPTTTPTRRKAAVAPPRRWPARSAPSSS